MSQMTMASIPGFSDLPDSQLAGNLPLTDEKLVKINNNAKFAALRPETFFGWYMHGETVVLPASPVDGYVYSRQELEYSIAAWDTRGPVSGGPLNGTAVHPARANTNAAAGVLFDAWFSVDGKPDTNPGLVRCFVSFWDDGTEHQTNSGMVRVCIIATRNSG